MVAWRLCLKCFLFAELQGWEDGPDFTSVDMLLCDVWNGKFGPFEGESVFTNPSCRISHARINKQKLPHFHFLL